MRPTHTLCFLTRGDKVLMIKRRKPPHTGLWNGVGGKIEAGEGPLAGCIREVDEETGFRLSAASFGGLLTWNHEHSTGGAVCLYTTIAPLGEPSFCSEGILQWHPWEWVLHSPRVVQNIHIFGPHLLNQSQPIEYYFEYSNNRIARHEFRPLPEWITQWV